MRTLLGTTYSKSHIQYLGLDHSKAFKELLDLKFDYIRIGTYWNEIQPEENNFNFKKIKEILDLCEERKQKVVLTVGIKAPRWPEFYTPEWLKSASEEVIYNNLLLYISKVVQELKTYSCISHWQVENEPLDPSGPENRVISQQILKQEIDIIKKLDTRPTIVNMWGNELSRRKCVPVAAAMADIIGIDIYYKQYIMTMISKPIYTGPIDSGSKIQSICKTAQTSLWIMELQAEPWEKNMNEYKAKNPKSMHSQILEDHYKKALNIHPEALFFWGYEYWYWKKEQGDSSMLDTIKKILA